MDRQGVERMPVALDAGRRDRGARRARATGLGSTRMVLWCVSIGRGWWQLGASTGAEHNFRFLDPID